MNYKHLNKENAVLFFKLYTREVIKALALQKIREHNIEVQKLKQKFIEPESTNQINEFQPSPYKMDIIQNQPRNTIKKQFRKITPLQKTRTKPLNQQPSKSFFKKIKKKLRKEQTQPYIEKPEILSQIQPIPQPIPENFHLGKIENFLRDPGIQSIECPGPGKNILVKKFHKINITRTSLNQNEINNIIDLFSKKSRIPISNGILKTAVGNLVITAVISEFVGSRFIISRIFQSQNIQK